MNDRSDAHPPTETCPEWCTQHRVYDTVDTDGSHPQRHTGWLFTRYAPIQPELPSTALYVTETECHSLVMTGPRLCLQQFDNPPQPLKPDEARRLAAALIAGADLVDAVRTAACPSCGDRVVPAELEHVDEDTGEVAGVCISCVGEQMMAERQARRDLLRVVR